MIPWNTLENSPIYKKSIKNGHLYHVLYSYKFPFKFKPANMNRQCILVDEIPQFAVTWLSVNENMNAHDEEQQFPQNDQ